MFDLRARKKHGKDLEQVLWPMSRPTAYRLVKRVMDRAGITGKQLLAQIMGHSDTKTTEIYLQVISEEKHRLVMDAWG